MGQPGGLGDVFSALDAGKLKQLPKHPGAPIANPLQHVRVEQVAHHDKPVTEEDPGRPIDLMGLDHLQAADPVVAPQLLA